MKHTIVGRRHVYATDVKPTAELMIRRLMENKYWFDVQHVDGMYTITCACDPTFVNDKFRMSVEGYIKGNYRRRA